MKTEDPKVFDTSRTDGVTVLQLHNDMFEEMQIAAFRRQLTKHVDENPSDDIVVSLDRVQRLGTESVGILVYALNRLREKGGDIRLCSLSKVCMQIFKTCNLVPQRFATYPTAADAIRSYQA